jgi:hypothetical protein
MIAAAGSGKVERLLEPVKAVYLSDPERACWANKWASLSLLEAAIACDPA